MKKSVNKRFYVTKKQVLEYISRVKPTLDQVKQVLKELNEYPKENACQIRFFKRVEQAI